MEKPINVNEGLWELCKYQYDQIKAYKEFIEKTILVKILEDYKPVAAYAADDPRRYNWYDEECRVLEVKIPETRFMMLQTPDVRKRWEMLSWDTPVVKPEIYLNLIYKAAEEQKKNAETD
jgi:hypothetical protein